jgi:hypothetical protein
MFVFFLATCLDNRHNFRAQQKAQGSANLLTVALIVCENGVSENEDGLTLKEKSLCLFKCGEYFLLPTESVMV